MPAGAAISGAQVQFAYKSATNGDTTCWYNAKHGELQVLKGTTFFSIELRRSGDPTEPIKAVARKVYDRLK